MAFAITLSIPAFAADSLAVTLDATDTTNEHVVNSLVLSEIPKKEIVPNLSKTQIDDYIYLWESAREDNSIYLTDAGNLSISNSFAEFAHDYEMYDYFLYSINLINWLMDAEVLVIDSDTFHIETQGLESSVNLPEPPVFRNTDNASPYWEPHDCGYPRWNVKSMVIDNRNHISETYNTFYLVSLVTPNTDPWLLTAVYWVNMVREDGKWDYKVSPEYGPYDTRYCMNYGNKQQMHNTAEWVGNYNYGYTGSFLFDLTTLYVGSSAVSGFKPSDVEDWPAIEEGYNDSL